MTDQRPLGEQERHLNALRNQLRDAVNELVASVHPEPDEWTEVEIRLEEVTELGRRGLAAVELLRAGAAVLGSSLTAESEERLAKDKRMMLDAVEHAASIQRMIQQL